MIWVLPNPCVPHGNYGLYLGLIELIEIGLKTLEESQVLVGHVAINYANVKGCRISPNVFTTTDELDVFVRALKELAA